MYICGANVPYNLRYRNAGCEDLYCCPALLGERSNQAKAILIEVKVTASDTLE
jgi:hypothetical protein